jgi:FkbM family methyltransferase
VDPDDHFQCQMLVGLYDPIVLALARRHVRPGSTVIDAGAHLGFLAMHFARAVGREGAVHCFECDPRVIGRLREHVALNECPWVVVTEAAVSDEPAEELRLHLPDQLGWASVRSDLWGAQRTATVRALRVDDHVEQAGIEPSALSFIKVDVEGAELQALRGMRETLRRTTAPVMVEFIPDRMRLSGDDPEQLLELMRSCGYRPWIARRGAHGEVTLIEGAEPVGWEDTVFLKPG